MNQNLSDKHGTVRRVVSIAVKVRVSCIWRETDALSEFCSYTSPPVEIVRGNRWYIWRTGSVEQFHLRSVPISFYILFFLQKVATTLLTVTGRVCWILSLIEMNSWLDLSSSSRCTSISAVMVFQDSGLCLDNTELTRDNESMTVCALNFLKYP